MNREEHHKTSAQHSQTRAPKRNGSNPDLELDSALRVAEEFHRLTGDASYYELFHEIANDKQRLAKERAKLARLLEKAKLRKLIERPPSYYADLIIQRAADPWVGLRLGRELIGELRLGSWAALMGYTGAGKSTLAVALLCEHADREGPALYLSLELSTDETSARSIGAHVGESWKNVLTGAVSRDDMIAAMPSRLIILDHDEDDVQLEQLDDMIEACRESYPNQPILAAVDYIQLAAGVGGEDVRMRNAAIAEYLRRAAKKNRIALLGVSQTSRANAKALRSGELVGADTTATGAESGGIEQFAYLTFAIGAAGPEQEDGSRAVELNIGKGRFGGGDRVVPMVYYGREGRWHVAGEARPAADVVADRAVAKIRAAANKIRAAADRAKEPQSRAALYALAAVNEKVGKAAIELLLAAGDLVACEHAARSTKPLLWTPARVAARGVVGSAAESG